MDTQKLLSNYNFKRKDKLRLFILLSIIIILVASIICFIVLYVKEKNKTESYSKNENKYINLDVESSNYKSYIPLSSWKKCDAKTKLSDYIANITNADNYVPKEDRIAVFDFDGTIFQENDPIYNDYKVYYYRVYNDSKYTPTEEQKKIAAEIKKSMEIGEVSDELIKNVTTTYPELWKDFNMEEYQKYIKDFIDKPCEGFENLKRGDAFYKPMIELIEYLKKNDFQIYISSGAERVQVRTVIDGHVDIPPSNIIGSEYDIIAKNQGSVKGHEYTYDKNTDDFRFNNSFYRSNFRTNKIIGIIREIGKHPLLVFGNAHGDSDMANYVMNNKNYPGLAFMICCDDNDREKCNIQKAKEMKKDCKENGWIPISMKDDWTTIYGENVIKK